MHISLSGIVGTAWGLCATRSPAAMYNVHEALVGNTVETKSGFPPSSVICTDDGI